MVGWGGGVGWLRPILVFSLSLSQAEQKVNLLEQVSLLRKKKRHCNFRGHKDIIPNVPRHMTISKLMYSLTKMQNLHK